MPITIGAKPESGFDDPIGVLRDCHRRIEKFAAVLSRVASRGGGALSEDERRAMETALTYFREAAPKHTADEEESLFPRMRQRGDAAAVLAQVDALESEHKRADALHAEVERLGQLWLSAGSLAAVDAERFDSATREIVELYRGHIEVEEGAVFPAAAAGLSAEERSAVGAEMAGRRGVRRG